VRPCVIGKVNYDVITREAMREVNRVVDPANARCSSVWPNW
jgi:hypothetical protein